eukprot:13864016-Ditylum_brightwellii.AAC.1
MNRSVEGNITGWRFLWVLGGCTEEEVSAGSAVAFQCCQVRSVRMDMYNHVTGVKTDNNVR